jgi:hypothetical protein
MTKRRWRLFLLLALCLLLDGFLALAQYPSLLGNLRILELSAMEIQVGLVLAVSTVVRARDGGARAIGLAGAWMACLVALGTLVDWRAGELTERGALAVQALFSGPDRIERAQCRIVGRRFIFFLARLEYALQCPSGRSTATVYFYRGEVVDASID